MNSIGFVYALSNPCMPDIYKIGCTERSPHARANELSQATGVPAPFEVVCYMEVPDFQDAERRLHQWLAAERVTESREFFETELPDIIRWMFYFPGRLSFGTRNRPYDYDHYSDHFDGEFYPLSNPWEPSEPQQPVVPKPFDPEASAGVVVQGVL